jgi:uncharacterized CHY-type Zn-finger protein
MEDEFGYQEKPLDFSRSSLHSSCPHCGETLDSQELNTYLAPESNTFICPNCRKRLNIHELGRGI